MNEWKYLILLRIDSYWIETHTILALFRRSKNIIKSFCMEQKAREQERSKKSSTNNKDEKRSGSSDKDKNTNGSVSPRDKSPTLSRKKSFFQTNPPEPWEIFNKEKFFILDCIAVKTIYKDSARTNPRLGHIIPPYNSQKDKHAGAYFKFKDVDKVLQLNNQVCYKRIMP